MCNCVYLIFSGSTTFVSKNSLKIMTFVDPLEIDAPIGRQPIHFLSSNDSKPEWMTKLHDQIITASGFIIVCPEYNATIAPALTNLLNYFPPNDYRHKPVSLITYSMGK